MSGGSCLWVGCFGLRSKDSHNWIFHLTPKVTRVPGVVPRQPNQSIHDGL